MTKPWEKYQQKASKPWEKYRQEDGDLDLEQMREDTAAQAGVQIEPITMLRNTPGSAYNLVADTANAVLNPIDTGTAVLKLLDGVIDKTGIDLDGVDRRVLADAAGQMISERYGSVDAFKNTLNTDPVGALADISGLLTGGLTLAGKAVPKLAGVANKAARVASNLDPLNLAVNSGKQAAVLATKKGLPFDWYEEVAKFSTTKTPAERKAMVGTALENKIEPTPAGAAKLDGLIGSLNESIDTIINNADNANTRIPVGIILNQLVDLKRRKGGFKKNAKSDLTAIDGAIKEFNELVDGMGRDYVTARELQDFKVDLYKGINWNSNRATGTRIGEDIERSMASGARQGVETVDPQVRGINQKLSDLYELQPHLERSAARIGNRNMLGLQTPMAMTGMGQVGGPEAAAASGVASFLFNPQNKAKLAIALYHLRNGNPMWMSNNLTNQQARYATLLAGRTEDELDKLGLLVNPKDEVKN